jgi:SsrA-binding protein
MARGRKADKTATDPNNRVVATNRSARHDYSVLDTIEAGIMLRGSEVKSLREAQVQIKEAHGRFENGELWLVGMHISPYLTSASHDLAEPDRKRKLLLHREQADRWRMRVDLERLQLVPLSLYFKDGKAKVELALAKGRTRGDKRQAIAERDARMEADKEMGRARKTAHRDD